jgi:hypothetical protein
VTETQIATAFANKVTNAYTSANLAYARANSGISTSANTTITGNMFIATGSRLGIGTLTPNVALHVNGTTIISETIEKANTAAVAFGSSSPMNFDVFSQPILFFTTNSSANVAINFRANSTTTLESLLANGQSMTLTALVTNGSTPYYVTGVSIDSSPQTVKWAGGTAPTSGNPSSVDLYSFTLIKTAPITYTVLGSVQKYS